MMLLFCFIVKMITNCMCVWITRYFCIRAMEYVRDNSRWVTSLDGMTPHRINSKNQDVRHHRHRPATAAKVSVDVLDRTSSTRITSFKMSLELPIDIKRSIYLADDLVFVRLSPLAGRRMPMNGKRREMSWNWKSAIVRIRGKKMEGAKETQRRKINIKIEKEQNGWRVADEPVWADCSWYCAIRFWWCWISSLCRNWRRTRRKRNPGSRRTGSCVGISRPRLPSARFGIVI